MIATHNSNFISVFKDVYPDSFCEFIISEFERAKSDGAGNTRLNSEGAISHVKDDFFIFANGKNIAFHEFEGQNAYQIFWDGLQKCFVAYKEKYSTLENVKLRCNSMKIQKTSTGGGYHVWHAEQGNDDSANRGLVYMLYLNTLPEGSCGETEFLYQGQRVKPEENSLIIWPAAFTHTHRGNAVYGDTSKYVITGWFYHE